MGKESIPTNYNDNSTTLTTTDPDPIKIKIVDPSGNSGKMAEITVDNNKPAHEQKEFMAGFTVMILASSGRSEFNNNYEVALLREAFKRHEVRPKEAVDAFWKAYGDPYVKGGEIRFRNLWKYIEEDRLGRDRRLYSYREVLSICDKEKLTTDAFSRDGELADKLKKENPDADLKGLQVWRRK